jgi:hypothetical protein
MPLADPFSSPAVVGYQKRNAQAVRASKSFEPEPDLKFDEIYELFSQRFQQSDFGGAEKVDQTVLPIR